MKRRSLQKCVQRMGSNALAVIAAGFAAAILIGSFLLSLPIASATRQSVGWFNALFTSTSAICVTGLVAVDTGTAYSTFGHVVLMCLIQLGGLGFMTFATLVLRLLGRQLSLQERLIIRESFNEERMNDLMQLIRWVVLCALSVELIGAAFLATRMVPDLGLKRGLFYSLFHSVSAFCNAGFDLFGNYSSLMSYRGDVVVNIVIVLLIIIGGLGFGVLGDLWNKRKKAELRLHTKLVLVSYGGLMLFGFLFNLFAEWDNPATLGNLPFGEKLIAALFQSVTLRTAGFNTIDQMSLKPATKLVNSVLMFIGAAPASTGGGIKVTTFAVIVLLVRIVARGGTTVTIFRRSLERTLVQRAVAIVAISIAIVFTDVIAISLMQPNVDLLDIIYECTSAMGTVGISSLGTPSLNVLSKCMLIVTMYLGRIGPLTMALLIARRQASGRELYHYPEDRIMIG